MNASTRVCSSVWVFKYSSVWMWMGNQATTSDIRWIVRCFWSTVPKIKFNELNADWRDEYEYEYEYVCEYECKCEWLSSITFNTLIGIRNARGGERAGRGGILKVPKTSTTKFWIFFKYYSWLYSILICWYIFNICI